MYDIFFDLGDMHQSVEEADEIDEYTYLGPNFIKPSNNYYPEDDQSDYPVIVERPKQGYHCKKCKELFPHSEPNQSDGTLICYSCRNFG